MFDWSINRSIDCFHALNTTKTHVLLLLCQWTENDNLVNQLAMTQNKHNILQTVYIADSGFAPSQWETALWLYHPFMMTSSNGNIFRVSGHLWGEFTGSRWLPRTKASDAERVFFDLCRNKRLSKQSWGWWFETLSCPLWRHCDVLYWCRLPIHALYHPMPYRFWFRILCVL